jgi:hypothetical protein
VQTFKFEDVPDHVSMETITFEKQGGRTQLRQDTVYQTVADRNAVVQSDMECGVDEGFAHLDELLATLAPTR